MIFVLASRIIMLTAGVLYPAYRSFKAVRNKDVKEYVKWMMYWIVFAIITCVEAIADVIISFWFPFYYELKIILIIWLISPWTKGASTIYRNFVHPWLLRHENDIDFYLEQAKTEGYNQALQIGTKGLLYARDIVATAAMRGQEQITQQLQRSLSMNDINTRRASANAQSSKKPRRRTIERQEDWIEEVPEERHLDEDDLGDTQSWAGPYQPHETTLINDDSPKSSRSSSRTPSSNNRSRSTSRTLSGNDSDDTPSKNLRSRKTLG